jgi:hypothetical protein
MKKSTFLFAFLVIVLVTTLWTPVPAAASSAMPATSTKTVLTINNKSVSTVTISMSGPAGYTIYAPVGVSTKEIAKGSYKVTYKACGVTKKVTVNANAAKAKLNIAACPMAKILITNLGPSTMSVTLSGPMNYRFSIPGRSSQMVSVMKGTYNWTSSSSCGSSHGTYLFSGKKRWTFWCN